MAETKENTAAVDKAKLLDEIEDNILPHLEMVFNSFFYHFYPVLAVMIHQSS